MAGRLVVSTFVSLDGVMQGPGGPGEDDSNDFPHGGWLPPHVDEGFGRIMGKQLDQAASMLLGRRSYEILASYWPGVPDEEGGATINGMPKYVTTRTPMDATWNNTHVLVGDAAQTVADLKRDTDGVILVQGSSDLIRTCSGPSWSTSTGCSSSPSSSARASGCSPRAPLRPGCG